MSLFKEKKKKVYKKKNTLEQTTIDSKHNNQLEYYTTLEKNIPSIKNELMKIEKEIDNLSKHKMCDLTPAQIENKLNLTYFKGS